jgi:hypothetical protein
LRAAILARLTIWAAHSASAFFPTRALAGTDALIVDQSEVHLVVHPSSAGLLAPIDISWDRNDQRPRLFSAAHREVGRPLECSFHLVGEPLRQPVVADSTSVCFVESAPLALHAIARIAAILTCGRLDREIIATW